MQKRLCGREQEFGMRIWPAPRIRLGDKHFEIHPFQAMAEKILIEVSCLFPALGSTEIRGDDEVIYGSEAKDNFWLTNGSRMYIDQTLLEVATPEHLPCTLDSVLYERSTEAILNAAVDQYLKKRTRIKGVALYKNNISYDSTKGYITENTYGSHQNYSCSRKADKRISKLLSNFLPAALPLTGNGHILYSGFDGEYCFSQRAEHISLVRSESTLSERPLINTRGFNTEDSLMADKSKARVHLISMDATRCEFQTWLVEGILHLVIRLAEEGWDIPRTAQVKDPVLCIKEFNSSFNTGYQIKMTTGHRVPVLQHLRIFLQAAKQLRPLSSGEKRCLNEWEAILDLLKDIRNRQLVGKLDWATKLFILNKQMAKHQFDLNSGQAMRINMEYHNISADPNQSWFARMMEMGYIERLSNDELVRKAISEAPQTRAYARGNFIRQCLTERSWRKKIGGMSWGQAFWNGKRVVFGCGGNPFSTKLD